MFNSVEYIRAVCKQRKIPVAQLEKDCGFANGYLNPKKMARIPYDRAVIVSEYLGIPAEVILTGKEKAPTETGERSLSDEDIMFALWGDTKDVDKEDLEDVRRYAAFIRERKRKK